MNVAQWLPSRWGALVLVLLALGGGLSLPRLQLDTRFERMLNENSEAARRYREFKETYGHDEFILVALSGKDLFEVTGLDTMAAAMDRLEQSDHVASVSGIPQIFMDLYGGEDPEALREEITRTPFYEGFFISRDRSMAGLVVEAKNIDEQGAKQAFAAEVRDAVEPLRAYGYDVDLVGSVIINEALEALTMAETKRFFPVALIVSVLILVLLLRSGRAAGAVMLCGLVTILVTLETVALSGRPLNIVTQSFPLILWMLTLANAIHIVTRYQFHLGHVESPMAAAKASLREVAFPCFLSSITTAFGFISLVRSEVPPIREFGMIMAVGMVYAFIVNTLLGSYLLVLFRTRSPRWVPQGDGRRFEKIGVWTLRRPWPVIVVFVALAAVGVYSLTQVRGEGNSLDFLPDSTPAIRSFNKVAGTLTGIDTMEILVDLPDSWLDTAQWAAIDGLCQSIGRMEGVSRIMSPLDYLRKLHQWDQGPGPEAYRLPENREQAQALVELVNDEDGGGLHRLVRGDGRQIRLTVLLTTTEPAHFRKLNTKIHAALGQLPSPLSGHVTGRAPQMQHMQVALVESQRKSFSMAFVLVFASIFAGLRSFRLLLVSVLPNLMPILSTFTVMMLLDIPLDPGTVMVASIALGIAVDDTVHVLAGYRRQRKQGAGNRMSILGALRDVGPSITVTSLTASAGFFILGTSMFKPLSYFGLASGLAIVLAFLADLYFVPAILAVAGREK